MEYQDQPDGRVAELTRFLDRLLSEEQRAPRLDDADLDAARALGLLDDPRGDDTPSRPDHVQLIALARRAIEHCNPLRSADQALETMAAPPAMPATVQ